MRIKRGRRPNDEHGSGLSSDRPKFMRIKQDARPADEHRAVLSGIARPPGTPHASGATTQRSMVALP